MALIVTLQNDGTGTDGLGNYRARVQVNDRLIWAGTVRNHDRRDPWRVLVRKLAETAAVEEPDGSQVR